MVTVTVTRCDRDEDDETACWVVSDDGGDFDDVSYEDDTAEVDAEQDADARRAHYAAQERRYAAEAAEVDAEESRERWLDRDR